MKAPAKVPASILAPFDLSEPEAKREAYNALGELVRRGVAAPVAGDLFPEDAERAESVRAFGPLFGSS